MKKVLIVDDEEAILKMYSLILAEKYNVLTAHDGETALEIIRKERPDLIYLDIIMPQLNGLDLLKKIKGNHDLNNIPVVVLTNLPKEASAEKAKNLGARDYFVKVESDPTKIAEVTAAIIGAD